MSWNIRKRWLRWGVASVSWAAILPSTGSAQTPVSTPLSPGATPTIEIYYGTRKAAVVPAGITIPTHPQPVVSQASAKITTPTVDRQSEAVIEAMHALRDGTRRISSATVNWLHRKADRPEPAAAVVSAAPATPATPAPPAVVIVREEHGSAAATDLEKPFHWELGMGMAGLCGLGFGLAMLVRRPRSGEPVVVMQQPQAIPMWHPYPPQPSAPAAPPTPVSNEPGHRLRDGLNVGPLPETAQKFDLGPTYQDDAQAKVEREKASEAALVEQILNQNLELLGQLGPLPEKTSPPEPELKMFDETPRISSLPSTPDDEQVIPLVPADGIQVTRAESLKGISPVLPPLNTDKYVLPVDAPRLTLDIAHG